MIKWLKRSLSNNFMFAEVMRDKDLCKMFLEEVLECKIADIRFITKEKDLKDAAYAHGIRLDVYLADENNTHYDVEMQNATDPLERRSRYYQAGIDRHLLEMGADYEELPESFIIFLCNFDYLKLGKAKYERISYYKDTDLLYDDGTHVLFLNTHYRKGEEVSLPLKEFLDYVRNANDAQIFSSDLANKARELTNKVRHDSNKEESFMTFQMLLRDERKEGLAEGKAEGIAEGIAKSIKMLKGLCLSKDVAVTQIAKTYNLSQEEAEEKVDLYW